MRPVLIGLLLGLGGSLAAQTAVQSSAESLWRAWLATQPADSDIVRLAQALDTMDSGENFSVAEWNELTAIPASGWIGDHPVVMEHLRRNSEEIRTGLDLAAHASLEWPPDAPGVLAFEQRAIQLHHLLRLLCIEARRRQAQGQAEAAFEIARNTLRFSSQLTEGGPGLPPLMVGLQGLSLASRTLAGTLADPGVSVATLQSASAELAEVDAGLALLAPHVEVMRREFIDEVRRLALDEAAREAQFAWHAEMQSRAQGFDEQLESMREGERALRGALSDVPAFEAELRIICDAWEQQIDLPPFARHRPELATPETEAAIAAGTLVSRSALPLIWRYRDRTQTHLRLVRAFVALRLHQREAIEGIIDPYSGEPVRVGEGMVYSVGPDGVDQQGAVECGPPFSDDREGDIVLRF